MAAGCVVHVSEHSSLPFEYVDTLRECLAVSLVTPESGPTAEICVLCDSLLPIINLCVEGEHVYDS